MARWKKPTKKKILETAEGSQNALKQEICGYPALWQKSVEELA